MESLRFNKLTKEVGLVLISSSLILSGCTGHQEKKKKDDEDDPAQPAPTRWHGGGGHGGFAPIIGRSGSGATRPGSSPAAGSGSVRGGFGATGHATSAGG
jgi:hypothetical protein